MRRILHQQLPLLPVKIAHEHARELEQISKVLDACPEVAELVHADLTRGVRADTGQEGLCADQVLRAGLIKQMNGFSYEVLAFHLADSSSYRWFCRLPLGKAPSKKALHRDISRIRPETWEAINRVVLGYAQREKIENGRKIRVDSTVEESNIHAPSDSTLLWDCVRTLARTMVCAREEVMFPFSDHRRRAKRRMLGCANKRKKAERVRQYRDLVKVTEKTVGYARVAVEKLEGSGSLTALAQAESLRHYIKLTEQVLDQTRRRVFDDEKVPTEEKIVSIFEPHTDIIVKDRRDTLYGHKLCLTVGASGLVTDCVIEQGNPADSSLAIRMIQRHKEIYGRPPRQAAFDGGFVSKANVAAIKEEGVEDVAFSKSRGIPITDMVKSAWVYKKLRNFRAGIEGCISFLKRVFGLRRCNWSGLQHFKAYTWLSIVTANLLIVARHMLA